MPLESIGCRKTYCCKIRLEMFSLSIIIQTGHPYALFCYLIAMLPLRCLNRVLVGINYDFTKYSESHCFMLELIINILKTETNGNSQVDEAERRLTVFSVIPFPPPHFSFSPVFYTELASPLEFSSRFSKSL